MKNKSKQLLFLLAGVCFLAGCGGEKADTEGREATPEAGGTEEDMLYADPENPPQMKLEYTSEKEGGPVLLEPFNFDWTYSDETGMHGVSSQDNSVFECKEITRIDLDGKTELRLSFSGDMDSVTAVRWTSGLWEAAHAQEERAGEEVALTEEGTAVSVSAAEPGYVYQITAAGPEGYAEFAVMTE